MPLPALFAAALAAAAPAPPPAQCPDEPRATAELGRADVPLHLHAFLDPTAAGAVGALAELRRVVGERPDELRISLWLVRPMAAFDPRIDRVRRFAWASARLGRLDAALTVIARTGADHVASALLDPTRVQTLARTLAVGPAALQAALDDRCDRDRLDLASAHLIARGRSATLGVVRLPAFALGAFVFDDAPGLERVRPELAREPVRQTLRWRAATAAAAAPSPTPRAERMRVAAPGGLVLGGVGLPHRLLVLAQSEDDPNLFLSLPRALQFRSEHPGVLSVHIIARGNGFGANVLRARLCAAARLGRALDYARTLAGPPDARRDPEEATRELLVALDREAETGCDDDLGTTREPLPEGTWLDGIPRSPAELDELPTLLRQSAAGSRPLGPWARPEQTDD